MDYLFNTPTGMMRRGKQYRVNTDRFFHIMNEGWFVYIRREKEEIRQEKGELETNKGVAGPFGTKVLANSHLEHVVHLAGLSGESQPKSRTDSSGEDWRY